MAVIKIKPVKTVLILDDSCNITISQWTLDEKGMHLELTEDTREKVQEVYESVQGDKSEWAVMRVSNRADVLLVGKFNSKVEADKMLTICQKSNIEYSYEVVKMPISNDGNQIIPDKFMDEWKIYLGSNYGSN